MSLLRRILGGRPRAESAIDEPAVTAPYDDDEERARELELARFDQERLDDLVRRQQRYATHSWTPPAQGGERRAEDSDADR